MKGPSVRCLKMRDIRLKNPARPLPKYSDKRQTAPRGIRRHGLYCNEDRYLRLPQIDQKRCTGRFSATSVAVRPQLGGWLGWRLMGKTRTPPPQPSPPWGGGSDAARHVDRLSSSASKENGGPEPAVSVFIIPHNQKVRSTRRRPVQLPLLTRETEDA